VRIGAIRWPADRPHQVLLVLALFFLLMFAYALAGLLVSGTNLYARPDLTGFEAALEVVGLAVWLGLLAFAVAALRRGQPRALRYWREAPQASRAVLVLIACSALKRLAILFSAVMPQASVFPEAATLTLRVVGCGLLAWGLLRGEQVWPRTSQR
jgi:hypothetical protein